MLDILAWQICVAIVGSVALILFSSVGVAQSYFLGCLSYVLPNLVATIFLRVWMLRYRWLFFGAEALKIFLSIIMILSIFKLLPSLQWIPFTLGLIVVGQVVFFVIWKMNRYGK